MSDKMIDIKSEIVGSEHVIKRINQYPDQFRRGIKSFLVLENRRFIGDNKRSGIVRKKLEELNWKSKVINTFKGQLVDDFKIAMTMKMGLIYSKKRKIHEILESLTNDHYTKAKNKNLIVPLPIIKKMNIKKPIGLLIKKIRNKEVGIIKKNGETYFIDRKTGELLFVGIKQVFIHKKINISEEWGKVESGVIPRFQKAIDKIVKRVEKDKKYVK